MKRKAGIIYGNENDYNQDEIQNDEDGGKDDGEERCESLRLLHTATSRKALWTKIESEVKDGKVQLADEAAAKEAVLKGDPCAATEQLRYGAVKELLIH